MSVVDYVKTPHMACPQCGGDPEWETKDSEDPCCNNVTVAEVMANVRGRERMHMCGICTRCNYFIEVYVSRDIVIDGEIERSAQLAIKGGADA